MLFVKRKITDILILASFVIYIHMDIYTTKRLVILCARFYLKLLKNARNNYHYAYCLSLIAMGFINNPLFFIFGLVYPLVFSFMIPNGLIFIYMKTLGLFSLYIIFQYKMIASLLTYRRVKIDSKSFLRRKYPKKVLLDFTESFYLFLRLRRLIK